MGPGDTAAFTQRFYSTLPDTFDNQLKMNLGQVPQDATVADRAFNVAQAANAHGGCAILTALALPNHIGVRRMSDSSRRQHMVKRLGLRGLLSVCH